MHTVLPLHSGGAWKVGVTSTQTEEPSGRLAADWETVPGSPTDSTHLSSNGEGEVLCG